jgi:hypothetical protein
MNSFGQLLETLTMSHSAVRGRYRGYDQERTDPSIRPLDESFPMYAEDHEFCMPPNRLRLAVMVRADGCSDTSWTLCVQRYAEPSNAFRKSVIRGRLSAAML